MVKITLEFTNKRAAEIQRTLRKRYAIYPGEVDLEALCHIAVAREVHAQSEDELEVAREALEESQCT